MNRPRHHFFAAARLSGDQDGAARRRHCFEQLEKPHHRLAPADDALFEAIPLFELSAKISVLRTQPALFQCGVEDVEERVDLKRLADEVVSAALDRVDRVLERAVTRDDDCDDIGVALHCGLDDARTVDSGETQVGDDDVECKIRETRDGSLSGLGLFDQITVIGELFSDRLTERSLVFNDQKMSCLISHLRGRQDFDIPTLVCLLLAQALKALSP